jgi:glycosyltransferase involved in cell wall biosynthesis
LGFKLPGALACPQGICRLISIIVPACNEAAVLERCLRALTAGAEPSELEVIVVCNGCTDDSAAIARQFGGPVRVIETPVGSKINALNLGDREAIGFPRFYADADVVLNLASIRAIAQKLQEGGVLAAAPRIQHDLSRCSWAVKAFYNIDRRTPSFREGIGGSGVYALSEVGRSRFSEFPQLTADDGFVRLTFKPGERCSVDGAESVVTPPSNLRGLIQIKTRSHFGSYELRNRYPELFANFGPGNKTVLSQLFRKPGIWPSLGVYLYVKARAKLSARRQVKQGKCGIWERDDTSRASSAHSTNHNLATNTCRVI